MNTMFVWTFQDVVGVILMGLFLIVVGSIVLCDVCARLFYRLKRWWLK